MKLAIICNRYHTSMLCKRAPVHLQCYATSTGTSNSTSSMLCYEHRYIEFYIFNAMLRAPVHRIQGKQTSTSTSTQKRSNLEYQYLLGANSYFDQSQILQDNLSQPSILLFQVQTKKLLDLFFLPSCRRSITISISTSRSTSAITFYS